jgi:prevent-host-death family protein
MPLGKAQQHLDALANLIRDEPVVITRRRKPVLVVMTYAHYEGMVETLDILLDQPFYRHFVQGIQNAQQGRTQDTATVRTQLGL